MTVRRQNTLLFRVLNHRATPAVLAVVLLALGVGLTAHRMHTAESVAPAHTAPAPLANELLRAHSLGRALTSPMGDL